jgi:predicted ester cyclase
VSGAEQTGLRDRRLALVKEHMDSELHYAEDVVIAELDLLGTHLGDLKGIAPTGRSFTCRMCALFLFEPGGERIEGERVYFDQATIARQLLDENAG